MLLFDRRLADKKLPRLAVMIGEAFGSHTLLGAAGGFGKAREATHWVLARAALRGTPAVGLVIRTAHGVAHRHMPVLLEMRHRAFGRIDRDMGEVRTAQPLDLGVEIGKVAPLQQRIVREIDARRHILGAESNLLGLGEEIVDDPI